MKKKLPFLILLLTFVKISFGQFTFNSTGWKYYYTLPTGVTCSEPPLHTPSGTGPFSWTSPSYDTFLTSGWFNTSNQLPIGYVSTINYGGQPINTIANFGIDPLNKPTTLYVRQTITLSTSRSSFASFTLKLKADDGVRVYFNGQEVANRNLTPGTISSNTSATVVGTDITDYTFAIPNTFPIHPSDPNKITITAEVHQSTAGATATAPGASVCTTGSSDLFFDCELTGTTGPCVPTITRGPYLQIPTSTSMQIRWRTSCPTNSYIEYNALVGGTSVTIDKSNLRPSSVSSLNYFDPTLTTEHIVNLTGLTNNNYGYIIGYKNTSSIPVYIDSNPQNRFRIPPSVALPGAVTNIWATGDCGADPSLVPAGDFKQVLVKNAFKNYIDANLINPDLWLLMGDNAYESGIDNEYQNYFFNIYQTDRVIRQTPILPAPGNHDYFAQGGFTKPQLQANHLNDYFNQFSMPTIGESGGVPSGNKGYYSVNYNNVHIISLDSYGFYGFGATKDKALFNDVTGTTNPQIEWLKADLAANTQKWTIMFWHHSPYTQGRGHDSDGTFGGDELILKNLREQLVPLLDQYKIDLVLCGHSHSYERTKLLKGHYGLSGAFAADELVSHNPSTSNPYPLYSNDNSTAKFNNITDCPYIKSSSALKNEGIVYAISGSAGWIKDIPGSISGHPAMKYTNMTLGGSFFIKIQDNRLDAKWIDEAGGIGDNFTIFKDVNLTKTVTLNSATANPFQNYALTASWLATYNWVGPGIIPSFELSKLTIIQRPTVGYQYTVTDNTGCLIDKFNFVTPPNPITDPCLSLFKIINPIIGPLSSELKVLNLIEATNDISSNAKVLYQAGTRIDLNPGFVANSGAVFRAEIKTTCP
jgi:acid phosphatase type 7